VSKVREKMNMDVSPMIGDGHGFGYLEKEKKPWMVVHPCLFGEGFSSTHFPKRKGCSHFSLKLILGHGCECKQK
jgi:hypothetical protein